MLVDGKHYVAVWMEGPSVIMINQPLIPHKFETIEMKTHNDTAVGITDMVTRGAGSIGAAAAFGMAQVFLEAVDAAGDKSEYVSRGYETLRQTRPTAQDLFSSLDRVSEAAKSAGSDPKGQAERAVEEAKKISDEYVEFGKRIGELGATLLEDGMNILTHCNAGWLALQDWGSALAPIYVAQREGKKLTVYADETRPRCQGARLTAWELMKEGVDCYIVADNASGFMMNRGEIDFVITGADRIAANGDVANKIGTYEKAVLAKENGIPFYVAAPSSTFDLNCPSGADIPIEERSQDEVLYSYGWSDRGEFERVRLAPENAKARNLAFDITPARYITGLINERGIIPATEEGIQSIFGSSK